MVKRISPFIIFWVYTLEIQMTITNLTTETEVVRILWISHYLHTQKNFPTKFLPQSLKVHFYNKLFDLIFGIL